MPTSVFKHKFGLVREITCVSILCGCMILTQSGVGQLLSTLDYIAKDFGIANSPGDQSWLIAAYSLLVGTLVLPMGSAGDILGHKKLVVAGYAWFTLWSLIAGLSTYAKNAIFFDVCRGFQGMGPAMLLPNGIAVLARLYPDGSQRKYYSFCLFAASAPTGAVLGSVFGAIFSQLTSVGWPLAFYVQAIVLALLGVGAFALLPGEEELEQIHAMHEREKREREEAAGPKDAKAIEAGVATPAEKQDSRHSDANTAAEHDTGNANGPQGEGAAVATTTDEKKKDGSAAAAGEKVLDDDAPQAAVRKFDYIGAFLGVGALILINVAWNQGANVGWEQWYDTYFLLIIGFVFAGAYVVSLYYVEEPLLPRDVWTTENVIVLSVIAVGWSSFGTWIFYSWRFWLVVQEKTVLTAGADSVPAAVAGGLAALGSGWLLSRPWFGPAPLLVLSLIPFCIGNALVATLPAQNEIYWTYSFFSFAITPFGMDSSFPAASIIISEALPRHRQGQAGSLVNTVVNYSTALGLGIAGTVEHYVTKHLMETRPDLTEREISERGFRAASFVGVGLSGLGIILAFTNLMYTLYRKGNLKG